MLRAVVLVTLVPDAGAGEVVLALAGDLARVAWARRGRPASPRSFGQWRQVIGPGPLEELQALVLGASWDEREDRGWRAVGDRQAEGRAGGRDADPDAGYPGEPGRVRVHRHRG